MHDAQNDNSPVLFKIRDDVRKSDDNQLDECQLTFEELGLVKKTLVKTLSITGHLRVKYPEKKRASDPKQFTE